MPFSLFRDAVPALPPPMAPAPPVLVFDGADAVMFSAGAGDIVNLHGGTGVQRRRLLGRAAPFDASGRRVARALLSDPLPEAPTVLQCVSQPLRRQGLPPGAALSRALLELDALGADVIASRPPSTLGLAEARLVQLARAMAARPRLLVLEAPECGLAPASVRAVRRALWTLASTFDTCIFMSTDDPQLQAMASRRIDLDDAGALRSVRPPA